MAGQHQECGAAAQQPPRDLSHHFSRVTNARKGNTIKGLYKYTTIPGIGNLAGGMPNASLFPYDTLEAQTAQPYRFQPTPNAPSSDIAEGLASTRLDPPDADASSHLVIPRVAPSSNPLQAIDLKTFLQYGQVDGYAPLLSFVRQFARETLHPNVPYLGGPDIILTCGNTDGYSKVIQAFTNEWSPGRDWVRERESILCEEFAYTSGLQASQPRGLQVVTVKMDAQGMLAAGEGGLEDVLTNWDARRGKRPHLLYTITIGQNPTGGVLSVQRRKEIYALCSKFDVIIIEDDPYWYLQYPSVSDLEATARGLPLPPKSESFASASWKSSGYPYIDSLVPSYLQFDTDGRVIRLDTFSKTVAPGCRLGWITAQPAVVERILRIAEASTAQPSGFVQAMIAELIIGAQPAKAEFARRTKAEQKTFTGWKADGWVRWLEGLRGSYERRMTRMCQILEDGRFHLKQGTPLKPSESDWAVISKTEMYSFHWPRGGMFVWLNLHFNTHPLAAQVAGPELARLFWLFLTQKPHLVLGAPGQTFCPDPELAQSVGWQYMRLCFAAVDEKDIEPCSERFARGANAFWAIKNMKDLEDIDDEDDFEMEGGVEAFDLAGGMGC